ncbi:MAG: YihY/virulence factor BrkB family protein [Armatimonadota bacterium]|nr:YihY/virulence factor BrkB family protein [Armatimonadota bacterium]
MKLDFKAFLELLKQTYTDWSEDKASRLAAALSFYTVFSLAPLLVVVVAIAGVFFGEEAARGEISKQMSQTVGPVAAKAIEDLLEHASRPASSIPAMVIGFATVLIGAAGLFGQLQDALNTVWEVQPKPGQGFVATIKHRFLSFAMVLGTGFFLLVSLCISAAVAALGKFLEPYLPIPEPWFHIINDIIAFVVISILFAVIYKRLPDVEIKWRDVWMGGVVTAILFTLGKFLLGLYLGRSSVASPYGAAGSFAVLLLWINYAAQIILFGAEFTQVYANKYGSHIVPSPNAVPVTEEARAQQGMPRPEQVGAAAHGGTTGQPDWSVAGAAPVAGDAFQQGYATALRRVDQRTSNKPDFEYVISFLLGLVSVLLLFGRRGKQE